MSLIKLAVDNEVAAYTRAGSIVSPLMIGAGLGSIGANMTGNPYIGLVGLAGGVGAGYWNYRRQKEKGEFKKKTLPGYLGTRTGPGAFGSSLLTPLGTGVYEGIKTLRQSQLKDHKGVQ